MPPDNSIGPKLIKISIFHKPTTAYLQINPDFLWHPVQQLVLWITDESRKELITC